MEVHVFSGAFREVDDSASPDTSAKLQAIRWTAPYGDPERRRITDCTVKLYAQRLNRTKKFSKAIVLYGSHHEPMNLLAENM